jgi:ribosomal protein S18 acetylase RimI-like enzyme
MASAQSSNGGQAASLAARPPSMPAPAFVVRRAAAGDVFALMDLKWRMSLADQTSDLINASADEWVRDCLGPQARFHAFVAERNGAVVGMLTFNEQAFAGWRSTALYVQDVFVLTEHRRSGIGRALLAAAASQATQCGACLVYLNVHGNNPARRLYERTGFEAVPNCVVHCVSGPAMHALAEAAEPEMPSGDS